MSIIEPEIKPEDPRPMKEVEFIDLIEHLRLVQEKASALALEQLELTKQLEAAFKKAHDLHQKLLADQHEVGGEG
jgi:hypothetical protein